MMAASVLLSKLTAVPFVIGDVPAACKSHTFLFLPSWWEYIPSKQLSADSLGGCSIAFHLPGDIWLVVLAVIDMLLRIAGFVAVISIIIAGFQLQFTMGSAEKAAAARHRMINSLIGLGIAVVAVAAVTFIGNQFAS